MTDLLADQARSGASEPPTATRMVLDTSVLISDPDSITAFPDADTVIPLVVVEELDQHKSRMDDVGRAARAVIRAIEELRTANDGDIRQPVPLPNGGTLRIETNGLHLNEIREHGLDPTKNDNRILAASLGQAVHGRTVVVSNDAALRIKAAQLGLEAMEHHRLRGRTAFERPAGWTTIEVVGGHRSTRSTRSTTASASTSSTRATSTRCTSSSSTATPCCGPAASRRSCATSTASSSRCSGCPSRGGSGRGRRSSSSPSTSCSTPRCASSPSTAWPAPARRSWRWPPGSSR